MPDTCARFTFSATDGRLEVVGSEDFVSKHLEAFGDVLRTLLQRSEKPMHRGQDMANSLDAPPAAVGSKSDVSSAGSLDNYQNLFAIADDKIQITKDIPGSSKPEKTINAALLCLFGNSLRGTDELGFDTIRDVCQAHSCLDSPNFARTLKAAKEYLICSGSSRKQIAKLSHPGKRQAEKMAKELNVQ
jgi:hypothetical protein